MKTRRDIVGADSLFRSRIAFIEHQNENMRTLKVECQLSAKFYARYGLVVFSHIGSPASAFAYSKSI